MTIIEWVKKKVLGILGIVKYDKTPDEDRLTFINDNDELVRMRLREYNIWYDGDGDELLNFYTRNNVIDYNYEPFYLRNKKNYFWALSSREAQIKRTHSGQPRNIVDTLVNILPFPLYHVGGLTSQNGVSVPNASQERLDEIIRECKLPDMYRNEQLPLTLVEGWGCYKINWDRDVSDNPYPVYYRAENVDFIYKAGRITGVIFKDYYSNMNKKYLLTETRHIESKKEPVYDNAGNQIDEKSIRVLVIEKELFQVSTNMATDSENRIMKVDLSTVPELKDVEPYIEIGPFDELFAVPVVVYGNTSHMGGYGRSIFTGKIDLFDDLDQSLSQAANTVRLSTPIEYFDSEFLERDRNGLPKKPSSYDRKYVMVQGQKNADGVSVGQPIQITQPALNINQYTDHAVQILLQIMNGILSPATLGIDISKRDNAEAQREKEKVTIFTRNTIIAAMTTVFQSLMSQLLCAKEFMETGCITVHHYDVSIKFNEFANDSFENRLEKLGAAFDTANMSEKMYMQKLYGDSLSDADFAEELQWLKDNHTGPRNQGMQGMMGDGSNLEMAMENPGADADAGFIANLF